MGRRFGTTKTEKLIVEDYIDFYTGNTKPSNASGRMFYDNESHSVSYWPDIDQNVKVDTGQQLYLRGLNNSGAIITKGSVLSVLTSTDPITDSLPNFTLRTDIHGTRFKGYWVGSFKYTNWC